MKIIQFIAGIIVILFFSFTFAFALIGVDEPPASTQTDAHRAFVADYASHTHDPAAGAYLRGNHEN